MPSPMPDAPPFRPQSTSVAIHPRGPKNVNGQGLTSHHYTFPLCRHVGILRSSPRSATNYSRDSSGKPRPQPECSGVPPSDSHVRKFHPRQGIAKAPSISNTIRPQTKCPSSELPHAHYNGESPCGARSTLPTLTSPIFPDSSSNQIFLRNAYRRRSPIENPLLGSGPASHVQCIWDLQMCRGCLCKFPFPG